MAGWGEMQVLGLKSPLFERKGIVFDVERVDVLILTCRLFLINVSEHRMDGGALWRNGGKVISTSMPY